MKTNAEFKKEALAALKGNWGKAILLVLVYALIYGFVMGPSVYETMAAQQVMQAQMPRNASLHQMQQAMLDPVVLDAQRKANAASSLTSILSILLIIPLSVGAVNAFQRLLTQQENDLTPNMFRIALDNYWHKVWGMLLVAIFTSLWTLLLIVPGIIKAFSYALTPYILEEYPELGANDAIDRSRAMMQGHKFDLFYLYLSFIGWFFLCLLTAGIGFLWLSPYVSTAKAAFYEEVKADYALNGGLI